MKSYKVVVDYEGERYGPYAATRGPCTASGIPSYLYDRSWFPSNGKPGPWLPRTACVIECRIGWHFAHGPPQLRNTPARWLRHDPPWEWAVGTGAGTRSLGVLEVWEIHFRHATHWNCKSAARTIRFVRKLSTDEVRALLEGA